MIRSDDGNPYYLGELKSDCSRLNETYSCEQLSRPPEEVQLAASYFIALAVSVYLPVAQEQTGFSTRNPLDEIRDELVMVLSDAQVPFTDDQSHSIALVLEESRRASESLFGEVMDFSNGPPQGERLDRARAGIRWMNEDFSKRVRNSLTAKQLKAWDQHLAMKAAETEITPTKEGTAGTKEQVQQIRINNNPFTTENQYMGIGSTGSYGFSNGGGVSTELFQRGGTGAYHGSYEFRFRDESLNARNAYSPTRPPYQQRNFNFNTSGPIIRDRLTASFGASQTESENVGTIQAETLDGPYTLGFTRPEVFRIVTANGTYQLRSKQQLLFSFNYNMDRSKRQGIGGFTLPSRAFDYKNGFTNGSIRHVWFKSERFVQDISYNFSFGHEDLLPVTNVPSIDVLGAFNDGGYSERNLWRGRTHNVRTLWIFTGNRWTTRAGGSFYTTIPEQTYESNFLGNFQFSSLDAYRLGEPTTYRVTKGNPYLKITHREYSMFLQNDYKYSNRLTLYLGIRYEGQNDLDDHNNFDPRVGFAYALGKSTVLRGGGGLFHRRLDNWVIREMLRLDGTRQQEIVISNPSYPDPFTSGNVTVVPPASRRVFDKTMAAPDYVNLAFSIERSLPRNLFVTVSYDLQRGGRLLRIRDLNAPLPGTPADANGSIPRPDPSQGQVWQLESSGLSKWHAFRGTMRQRFSIFSLNATYTYQLNTGDESWNGPFATPSNSYNLKADWASVTRHQFSGSVNSKLPMGIYLTASLSINNGNPYSITTGKDDNGDGVTNDRPAGVPRLSRIGPMYKNVSFNLSKAFKIRGKKNDASSLNVFANVNNAFNIVNRGTPSGVLTSSFFRKSTSASNPREIEVGMRYQF